MDVPRKDANRRKWIRRILVIGISLAADSNTYLEGGMRLLPPAKRKRGRQIINAAGEDLRKWLLAMTLDMLFLGFVTGVGLYLPPTAIAFDGRWSGGSQAISPTGIRRRAFLAAVATAAIASGPCSRSSSSVRGRPSAVRSTSSSPSSRPSAGEPLLSKAASFICLPVA